MVPGLPFRRVARGAAGLAGLTGAYGFLYMMGAFGPVSCWTGHSEGGSSQSSAGSGAETTAEVTRGCTAGVDYLLSGAGGNAPVLFFWAVVLLGLVALGGAAAWTGRRSITWVTAVAGVVVSVIGVWSIGWYFVLPTLFLLAAATALTVEARRDDGGRSTAA